MLSDYFSEINDHGTVVPVKDLAAFPRSEQAVLGAYNVLPTGNVSHNDHGIVVSTDSVGIVTVTGTLASDAPVVYKTYISNYKLPVGRYKMVGCPPNGGNNLQNQLLEVKNGSTIVNSYTDIGEGVEFEITDASYTISVYVPRLGNGLRGQACNFVYKPMITTDLNATYNDFVPYAMTNRELTENKVSKTLDTIDNTKDLDDYKETGFYAISSSPAHAPESLSYVFMDVRKRDYNNNVRQIIYGSTALYLRGFNGTTWSSWYKFNGTEVTS